MADLLQFLALLDSDPDDANVLAALADTAGRGLDATGVQALGSAKKNLCERGRHDVALRLLDVELAATAGPRRADLLVEKGQLLDEELLDEPAAARCYEEALGVRPDDEVAAEALQQMALNRANDNWKKFAAKYVDEARASTDRKLTTGLYLTAAETWARYAPGSPEIEAFLRRSLEADPHNRKAALHLERLLRAAGRWPELATLLEAHVDAAATREERIAALLGLVEVCAAHLGQPERALEHGKKVLAMDPAQPRALRLLGDAFEQAGNWQALVKLYAGAFKAKGDAGDLGLAIQVGMILWKRLDDLDGAEEYFRRIRKADPAHPAALDFYRAYHGGRGEGQKLVALLRQAEKALPAAGTSPAADARARALALEIAELSESQLATPDKAIDAWKQLLRSDPTSTEAREALKRLYRKAEKWNPLLDLLKDEIERRPESDVRGKVERLYEVVAIYRDSLRQDPMVLNTYNAILRLDPEDRRAVDELAAKYRAMGRWQDLIGVLGKKAELGAVPVAERAAILRETAELWIERFGNFAQAIRPLERLLELAPADSPLVAEAVTRLKDIYTRRRQWRQLIGLLGREADAAVGDDRLHKLSEMARLAAERVGDTRLSIEIHNRVIALHPGGGGDDTLAALASLYEREKRWLALAEILDRQRTRAASPAEAVALLEKQGALLADRVGAPAQAAAAFAEILRLDPTHGKALRTLRELYAAAGDWDGLERLYGGLEQWDELCDALVALGDRQDDREARLALFRRAAAVAERKGTPERVARTWERVLAVEATDLAAARALAPVYHKAEKWSKLLPVLEVILGHTPAPADQLALMSEIRTLCEQRLGSRALALTWTGRAFDLAPDDPALLAELLRLAHQPEHWREVATIVGRHAGAAARPADTRLRLLRALAELHGARLGDLDAAREVEAQILALVPGDADAAQAYEELSERLSDWPALLASRRRRLDAMTGEGASADRRALLARIAELEEVRLADLDAAAVTWQRVLGEGGADAGGDAAALAALARLHGARGDWPALAAVLARQLEAPGQVDDRRGLLMQLGALEEKNLDRPVAALEHYLAALLLCRVPGPTGTIDACARFLDERGAGAAIPVALRREVARALRPHLESGGEPAVLARCLEIIATGEPAGSELALELDRRLVGLHHGLGQPERAWDAAARVVAGDPGDVDARAALTALAHELGRTEELAIRLGAALTARKAAAAPPAELRALAAELALLHANDLGDRAGAEKAWIAVLEAEPDDAEAFDELAAIYRSASRWDDLRALLERRVAATAADGARKATLLELAQLDEEILGDPGRAVGDYRRVLEIDPAHLPSYQALERLYAEGEAWRELDDVLAREVDHVEARAQVGLVYRRAELHARQLGDPAQAVELLEDVVTLAPGHADGRELLEELLTQPAQRQRVARLLEPLYERDGLWRDLCGVLRAQREAASEPAQAVELLARIALVEETHLESGRQAFDTWVQALLADPSDPRPPAALVRLAGMFERWNDAAAALDRAAAASPDPAVAVPLLRQLAEICDVSLGDSPRAIAAYQRLYEVDPLDPDVAGPTLTALARLFEEEERWRDLRDTLRRQAEAAADPAARKALLARVATLEETRLDDRAQATATWRDVLAGDPDDADALAALERLYELGAQWTELGDILRHQVDLTEDVAGKTHQLFRLVALHEHKRRSPADAVLVLLEVLDLDPDDTRALDELARLHRAADRQLELFEVLERRLAIADALAEPGVVARRHELAQLLAGPLGRRHDALDRWAEVLAREPGHEAALAAVRSALDDRDDATLGARAAAILEPLYESTGADHALCDLLVTTAGREVGSERVRRLVRVAQLRERRLGDPAGALEVTVQALRAAVGEPELPDLLVEVERLAAELGREGDLIEIYRGIADDVLAADLQRRLYLDVADLALAVRDDAALARTYYQKVLDGQPDDPRALGALEGLYRRGGDVRALYDLLTLKAELVSDPGEKLAALTELATLAAGPVDRPDDAIAAWEEILEVDPSRADAVAALDGLYRRERRWPDVVDLYERRMGFVVTIEEAVALRVKLAEVQERELADRAAAIDSYAAALGGDPGNAHALAALERMIADPDVRAAAAEVLEPIYIARQDWPRLARLNEAQLEASSDPGERLDLTRQIARLYEEQLEDLDGAFRWYARVFREDPTEASVRDQLHRLATILDDWPGLARVYQGLLDDEPGDAPHLREVAIAAATIYDRRLDAWEPAAAAYERVLASPGDGREDEHLFARLEALLARHGQWARLARAYDDAIGAALEDRRRRDLWARKAQVAEVHLGDGEAAIAAWRAMLDLAVSDDAVADRERASAELERLLRAAGRWYDVAELITGRLDRAGDEREEVEHRLALAEVLEQELRDLTGAIDQYELVLGTGLPEQALPALERLVTEVEHRERIASLLEPVYRARDWWQKLVVILDARLAYVDDPADKVALHLEIAGLHDTRGGSPELAFAALAQAWQLEPTRRDVFDRLCAQGARLGAWDELVTTLTAGATATLEPEAAALAHARVAEIQETQKGDHDAAIAAWRKVLEIAPDDALALSSLDRLYAVEDRADELVRVVERRAELAEDAGVRLVLLHRVASLYEEVLERPREAVAAYKNVLTVDESDEASLDALERLYRQLGEPRELVQILERKLELARDPGTARQLRLDLAVVSERELGDTFEAQGQLQAVLDASPDDPVALAELDRLYQVTRMWPELLEVLDRRAAIASPAAPAGETPAELAFRAARLLEVELADPDQAIPRYGAVLSAAPGHAGARAALAALLARDEHVEAVAAILERHLRATGDHDGLVEVLERQLAAPGADPDARRARWAALADVHELQRQDLAQASATWARALAEDPGDLELFAPLERLAQARGAWAELAQLLERRLEGGPGGAGDSELQHAYALRLGRIYEDALGDFGRAAVAYRRAVDTLVDERGALAALDRTLWRLGRWGELADVLAREADVAESDAQAADLLFRLGDVRESQLHDLHGAVDAYRAVVERQSRHGAARASLERLLGTADAERGDIIATLEPLYEAEDEWGRLADLLAAKLAVTEDHHERAAIYQRIATLAEDRLGDGVRALDAAGGWLAEDPTSAEALSELDRLAATQGRWVEVAARVQGVARHAEDTALPLWIYLGTVQLDRLGDAASAAESFAAALAIDDEHAPALEALERIHRERGDAIALAQVQARRAELAFDPPRKQALWTEVAELRERLGELDGAIAAWEAVIDLADDDRLPLARLAAIHERRGDRRALVTTLERAARIAGDAAEEKALRVRIATLEAELGDPAAAAAAWQAVLDLDPDDGAALAALEDVHTRAGDWMAVQDVLTRKLELARSSSERTAVLARMARLAERERGSLDDAIGHWYAALEVDNAQLAAYGELERLLGRAERWHDLVELLERRADLHGTLGDGPAELAALARAADIWEGPLDDPDAAGEILEKILRREPGSVAALTRLARIHERAGDWARCGEVLERALALGPRGQDAADLFFRLGEVADKAQHDLDTAGAHYRQALVHDPAHPGAVAAIERLARDQGDWATVGDMLDRRLAAVQAGGEGELLALALELADVKRRIGDPAAALPVLEQAAATAPDDVRVLAPLADLYVAARQYDRAAPIYARLADEARAARRMKDVARYRQRQGGLLEARGDAAGALAAYEEAFRVNPTDVPTMAGLGRLYMAARDWEKARRVYRSLVLQNLGPDAGISKPEVYLALGDIHLELGERPQAKGMYQRGLELEPHHPGLTAAIARLG